MISIVLFIIKIYYLIKDNQLREKNHLNGLSTVNFIIALFKWFKMQDLKKKDFVTKKAAPKKRYIPSSIHVRHWVVHVTPRLNSCWYIIHVYFQFFFDSLMIEKRFTISYWASHRYLAFEKPRIPVCIPVPLGE